MFRTFIFATALAAAQIVSAEPYGVIRVIDGDTFRIDGITVRLHAIDAPERDQTCQDASRPNWACGEWVRKEVRSRYDGRTARCTALDTDRYGRVVAKCRVDGQDVGERLVSDGLAFAYRTYGLDYDLVEKRAAVTGRGLHATGIMSPSDFRARQRAGATQTPVRASTGAKTVTVNRETGGATQSAKQSWLPNLLNPGCKIKGNISLNSGERIYHVPGQEHYGKTRISVSKGERWFCSEAEARAAGWRKARN
ncbi:thermonuclease family protein [Marivita sp. XM-24bin2]|jgi:endonuclease YncB( thermonuclease family)|uniref:thermonuclease family protein n=1 Tax=unclassified Marivita TaxID=2632480 RepID=UPI000D7A7067|nr:thermonuclease family protein [Marivita sp. XM-24bin2]MCR9108658.1 thermonuclease family protein [Paracoccaceae bacterium]PWL33817.1 MAG: nuclease [Marivita sp. XM-24bin2]